MTEIEKENYYKIKDDYLISFCIIDL